MKSSVGHHVATSSVIEEWLLTCVCVFVAAPPSYEACVYGGATLTDDEFTMGQTTFVPVYQVYNTLRSNSRSTAMSNRCSTVESPVTVATPLSPVQTQVSSGGADESMLESTVVEMSYSEARFNPNDERYIYSTPNPNHQHPALSIHERTESRSSSQSPSVSSPAGIHPMFRPNSSSPAHSPQHESEEMELSVIAGHAAGHDNGHMGRSCSTARRESAGSDNESTGLPEDAMIPLSGKLQSLSSRSCFKLMPFLNGIRLAYTKGPDTLFSRPCSLLQ